MRAFQNMAAASHPGALTEKKGVQSRSRFFSHAAQDILPPASMQ